MIKIPNAYEIMRNYFSVLFPSHFFKDFLRSFSLAHFTLL
jgi:hypothetical protein